ncbi:hypothetical protein ABTE44_19830, partial [Acinetobacter baumannii]
GTMSVASGDGAAVGEVDADASGLALDTDVGVAEAVAPGRVAHALSDTATTTTAATETSARTEERPPVGVAADLSGR